MILAENLSKVADSFSVNQLLSLKNSEIQQKSAKGLVNIERIPTIKNIENKEIVHYLATQRQETDPTSGGSYQFIHDMSLYSFILTTYPQDFKKHEPVIHSIIENVEFTGIHSANTRE